MGKRLLHCFATAFLQQCEKGSRLMEKNGQRRRIGCIDSVATDLCIIILKNLEFP